MPGLGPGFEKTSLAEALHALREPAVRRRQAALPAHRLIGVIVRTAYTLRLLC